MENYCISIGRQLGSGGSAIGKALAKRFGFQYIDKEIHDRWRQICPNGEKPTPEQLITYVTDMINKEFRK